MLRESLRFCELDDLVLRGVHKLDHALEWRDLQRDRICAPHGFMHPLEPPSIVRCRAIAAEMDETAGSRFPCKSTRPNLRTLRPERPNFPIGDDGCRLTGSNFRFSSDCRSLAPICAD